MKTLKKNIFEQDVLFSTPKILKVMSVDDVDSPPVQNHRKSDLSNFIKIYFDFTFCLLMSPFRFVRGDDNQYHIKSWRPHQVLCAVVHTMVIFRLVAEIRNTIPESRASLARNPGPYFSILMTTTSGIYKVTTMKRFWMHRKDYLNILNGIAGDAHLSIQNMRIAKAYICYLLYGQAVVQITCCITVGKGFVAPIWTWSPTWWLKRIVMLGRFIYCFGEKVSSDTGLELADLNAWDVVLAILTAFTMVGRYTFGYFCDLGLLAHALTLWTAANSFAKDVKKIVEEQDMDGRKEDINLILQKPRHSELKWPVIYKKYVAVQNLSLNINNALGSKVTFFLGEALLYYSINMNSALLTKDIFQRIYLILFYVSTFTTVIVSADICNQMESIKLWLKKDDNAKKIPSDESALVLHEMLEKDIGIRGSNIFTLTYGVIASFLSLIVTFFVICVQQTGEYRD